MAGARARDALRRSVGALTVTALLGAAVAVSAGLPWPSSAAPSARGPAGAVPSLAPSQSTLVRPTPSPARTILPTPRTSPTPMRPGEAVGAPGIAITTRPESDGSFLVSEVITLPAPATEAVLRPPSIGDAGTRFKQLRPTAMQVEVSAGGLALAIPNGLVRSGVMLRWDSPTQQLRLRYRLTQVSVASRPAKAGRTVAALGSLLDQMPADLPVKVVVTGRTVLSLTCPQLPLARLSCGAGIAPKFWTLRSIPFDRSQVLVQYDRPARP
ncbi:MAG TPA: hypothetical protein VFH23_09635 [Jiangellaceae bacterium]|nr:hypothetical protein [Jiangellaceae bacterium]